MPRITIVVSTLGNYDVLGRVLDGYARQRSQDFELIVALDKAEPRADRVTEAIGRRPYPLRTVTGRIPGLSANRNAGWRAAQAPIVLFTDNDTIPARRLVSEHVAWHGRHPEEEVAVVGRVRWARQVRVTPFMRWLERGVQFDFDSIDGREATWAHLYGANCSMKRGLLSRVGGYDEERLPYGYEDLDLAYRAREHGLRVLYNRRAVVHHLRHDMTLEFWRRRIRRVAAAERRFTSMHPELSPHVRDTLSAALRFPPGTGRGARVARFVPRWLPLLGPRVWTAAELHWRQQLAPHFLEAWEEAAGGGPAGPDLSERSDLAPAGQAEDPSQPSGS